eukprot:m.278694 g.278694  ORF g.278694 m.278694 type:complete len:359 (-) comp16317_c0_seq7:119-1195(-)
MSQFESLPPTPGGAGHPQYPGRAGSGPISWEQEEEIAQNLREKIWYNGRMDRKAAEEKLQDHEPGTYLVRVSERQKGYAISVRYDTPEGQARISHVIVLRNPNQQSPYTTKKEWLVHDKKFNGIEEAVEFYRTNRYRDMFSLGRSLNEVQRRQARSPTSSTPITNAGTGYNNWKDGEMAEDAAAPVPPARPKRPSQEVYKGPVYEKVDDGEETGLEEGMGNAYITPRVLLPDAEKDIDFTSEMMYLEVESTESTNALQAPPLPDDPWDWETPDVSQFLTKNDLDAFKSVLYRNGIDGKHLLCLDVGDFPPERFTKPDLRRFEEHHRRLRQRSKQYKDRMLGKYLQPSWCCTTLCCTSS